MDRAPRDAPPASPARGVAFEPGGTVKRITAAIRFRPATADEIGESAPSRLVVNGNTVRFNGKKLRFDHILPAETTQEELYNRVVSPLVQTVMDGHNAAIIAYGQTGAGKTYTMGFSARDGLGVDEKGVVDRFFDGLFARMQANATNKFTVRASHMQVVGKNLEDLLGSKGELKIVEQAGVVTISNLTQQAVHSAAETVQLLRQGCKHRRVAATNLNAVSSRSHSIFTVYLSRTSSAEIWAKVSFVDLAGSERCKQTKSGDPRFAEGVEINTALSALGNVIGALAKGSSHVPFRNHNLTRFLQNDLGGNSRVVVIACVSPASVHHHTTIQTIEYVGRVMKLKEIMIKNLVPSRRSSDAPVGPATGEHARTTEDLFAQLQSTVAMTSAHRVELAALRDERICMEEQVREVKERFAEMSASYERIRSLFDVSRVETESLRIQNRQLEAASAQMSEIQNERDVLAVKHASVVATQNECFNMFNEDLLGMRRRERELEERCAELSARYERTRSLLDISRTEAETLRIQNRQLEVASARTAVEQAATVATHHERFNMLTEDLLGMREREQHAAEAGRDVHGLKRHERVQVLNDMLAALDTMEKGNIDVDGFQSVVTAGIEARIRSEMHDFLSQGGSQCDLVALSSRL